MSVVLVVRESSVFRSQTHRLSQKEDSISNDNNYSSQKSDERILSPSHPRNVIDSPECSPHREAVNDVSKSWIVFDKYKKDGSLMNYGDPKNNLAKTFPSNYDISSMLKKKNNHFSKRCLVFQLYGEKFDDSDGDTIKSFLAKQNRKSSHRSDVDRCRGRTDRSGKKIEFMTDSTTMSDEYKKRNITSTIDIDSDNVPANLQHVNSNDFLKNLVNSNHDEIHKSKTNSILKTNPKNVNSRTKNFKSNINRNKISGFSLGKELRNPTWIQSPEKIKRRKNNNDLDAFLDNLDLEENNDIAHCVDNPTKQVFLQYCNRRNLFLIFVEALVHFMFLL